MGITDVETGNETAAKVAEQRALCERVVDDPEATGPFSIPTIARRKLRLPVADGDPGTLAWLLSVPGRGMVVDDPQPGPPPHLPRGHGCRNSRRPIGRVPVSRIGSADLDHVGGGSLDSVSEVEEMGQEPADWPPDKRSRFFLRKFPNNRFIRKLRTAGVLSPDEQVLSGLPMSKRSPAVVLFAILGVLPALLVLFALQRFCYLILTNRRILVTRWSVTGTRPDGMLELQYPVHLSLSENPKPSHFFGNKVRFPQEIAQFLGRETAYTQLGNVADYAFRQARGSASGSTPTASAPPPPAASAPAQTEQAAGPPAPSGYEGSITLWAQDERTAQDLANDRFYLFGALKTMESQGNDSAKMFLDAMNKGQSWSASTTPNAEKGGFDVTLTLT